MDGVSVRLTALLPHTQAITDMDTSDTNSSSPTASPVADKDEANMASIAR